MDDENFTLKMYRGSYYLFTYDAAGKRIRRSTGKTNLESARKEVERWQGSMQRKYAMFAKADEKSDIEYSGQHLISEMKNMKRSEATLEIYEAKLKNIREFFGSKAPVASITANGIDDYIKHRKKKGIHSHTIHKELRVLSKLLQSAYRKGWFPVDPKRVLPVSFDAGYVPRTRFLTLSEARMLLSDVSESVRRYIAFVFCTTARNLAVTRALSEDYANGEILVRDQKTMRAWRRVPVTPLTEEFVRLAFDGAPPGLLVPKPKGVRNTLRRVCKKYDWAHLSPNDLRRSVVHWFREAGVPVDVVSDFCGHSSTKMVEKVYGVRTHEELSRAMSRHFVKTESAVSP